jgi:hypothetical protein
VRPVHGHDERVTALLHQRVRSGFVCWLLRHGYRLFLDMGCELVKKCNTF